jgi:hypothetical protein
MAYVPGGGTPVKTCWTICQLPGGWRLKMMM